MKPFAAITAVLLGVGVPVLVAAPQAEGQGSATSCVEVGGISVWGVTGYNHVVYLTNRCEPTFACVVFTDVDPKPLEAIVPGTSTVQVITALDSPSPFFFANVSCEAM